MSARGYFGIGVYHPKTEANIGTLWRSASIYEAAFVFTIGRRYQKQSSDTMKTPRHTPLLHFDTTDDLLRHLPWSCPVVGVEQSHAAHQLPRYGHLERACYLLGAEDSGLPQAVQVQCHSLIEIPTPEPRCLNVAVAGSIVMHDRFTRGVQVRERMAVLA